MAAARLDPPACLSFIPAASMHHWGAASKTIAVLGLRGLPHWQFFALR